MYVLLLPPGINALVVAQSMQGNWMKIVLSIAIKLFCFCRCSGIILFKSWSQSASYKFYTHILSNGIPLYIDWKEMI